MLLFRSEEHLERWRSERDIARGEALTPQRQWDLARSWYADRLSPDWRRPSPSEAEETFARHGLTGPFWTLTSRRPG